MATPSQSSDRSPQWSAEAIAMAARARVLSGDKLEQLVVRLQRHSGRSKETCWRFVIQYGIKRKVDHRRWTESELDLLREELVKRSVEEVAKKLKRTPKAIRNILRRNQLSVREIRCDLFSVEYRWRAPCTSARPRSSPGSSRIGLRRLSVLGERNAHTSSRRKP